MSGSFYPGVRPIELIPGDPAALRGLAGRLQVLGGGLGDAAAELRTIDSSSWQGQAADAFRHVVHEQPGRYSDAAAGFTGAATAIQGFALTLETAQQDASRAIAMQDDADAATSGWQQRVQAAQQAAQAAAKAKAPAGQTPAPVPVMSSSDPGDAGRAQAESVLSGARAQMDQAAARLQAKLDAAKHAAPHKPGLFSRLVHGAEHLTKDFVHLHDTILNSIEGAVVGGLKAAGKFELRGLEAELHALGTAGRVVGIDPKGWYDALPSVGRHFLGGVWTGTVELAKTGVALTALGWKMSPTRMMIDPLGWQRDMTHLGKTVYGMGDQAIMHPTTFWPQFGKSLINFDEWKHDPAKALGELVPGIVLAVATAGAGLGAEGASRAAIALGSEAREFEVIAAVAGDEDMANGAMAGARIQRESQALKAAQRDLWLGRHAALQRTEAVLTATGVAASADGASTHTLDGGVGGIGVEKGMEWGLKPGEVAVRPATVIVARVFVPIP